jgi:prevent-host-death family protein
MTSHATIAIINTMKDRVVSATEFKAKCLAYLDEIEERGGPITITRRGKPVAVLGPVRKRVWKSPANKFAGRAEIVGDIVNLDTSDLWEVNRTE